jgi:YidC/Oxa1 family membrane protein insertase
MNLYRSSKVNPFGGCLPTVVQIPVMIALFQVLNEKGRFAGQALFGLPLDARPNNFAAIADNPVLLLIPILMAVTTYLQQRNSVTDPQQARLFIFMPFMVAWFSLNFPVGLSVYWIVSTVVYLLEYLLIVGRPVRPAPAMAREGSPGRSRAGGKTKKNP